ncbi:MAG: GspH/FimT family pseudopilin [Acidobacteriota bacterium]
MRRKNGFTIIELLVVIAILSIMFLMILGMSRDQVGRAGLKGSANKLIGEIYNVKSRAAKENRSVAITFSSTSYKQHFWENGVWTPDLGDQSNPEGKTASETTITNYTNLAFNSRGILIDPITLMIKTNVTLTLESDQGEGIKVKVLSYGGIQSKNSWRDSNEYGAF